MNTVLGAMHKIEEQEATWSALLAQCLTKIMFTVWIDKTFYVELMIAT